MSQNPPRIIIVDDEFIIAQEVKEFLIRLGYHVPAIVASGEDALRKIGSLQPDLVLMDVVLRGDMNGIEAADQTHTLFDVPVIYMTSHTDQTTFERALKTAPYGFLYKPVKMDVLHAAVDIALYKHRMQKQLMERESRLNATLNSIGDGVIATDTLGEITFMNPVAETLTGWRLRECIGSQVSDVFRIVHEKTRQPVHNPVKEVLKTGIKANLANHTVLIAKDGKEYQIADSASPILDATGEITGVVLVFRDVTREYGMRRKIRESEIRFRSLFEQAGDGIAVHDLDGRIMEVNQKLADLLGYTIAELCALHILDLIPVRSASTDIDSLNISGHVHYETKLSNKSGQSLSCEITSTLIETGGDLLVQTLFRDITKRKIAEEALRKSEELFRTIIETSPDSVMLTKVTETGPWPIVMCNPSTAAMHGYTLKEMRNMTIADLNLEPWDDGTTHFWLQRLREPGCLSGEVSHRRKDGTVFPIEYHTTLLRIDGDEYYLAVDRDISDRKHAEAQIKNDLEEKKVLLKEIHHRVKNNMNVITSLLHLQSSRIQNKEQAIAAFDESRNRIYSMSLVHEQLYQSDNLAHVNMNNYIETLSRELHDAYAGSKQIRRHLDVTDIHLNVNQAIPCGLILNELITNIFKHAFKDRNRGNIHITFNSQRDGRCLLQVRDDGISLPKDFDPHQTRSMGLKLVTILTQQLGGELEMTRKKGTAFTIRFRNGE